MSNQLLVLHILLSNILCHNRFIIESNTHYLIHLGLNQSLWLLLTTNSALAILMVILISHIFTGEGVHHLLLTFRDHIRFTRLSIYRCRISVVILQYLLLSLIVLQFIHVRIIITSITI